MWSTLLDEVEIAEGEIEATLTSKYISMLPGLIGKKVHTWANEEWTFNKMRETTAKESVAESLSSLAKSGDEALPSSGEEFLPNPNENDDDDSDDESSDHDGFPKSIGCFYLDLTYTTMYFQLFTTCF